jgi:U2 small nuclear ribonucleoprotein A'
MHLRFPIMRSIPSLGFRPTVPPYDAFSRCPSTTPFFSITFTACLQNQFDSIDLSDNAIVRLEGFPKLPRLSVLYANNNRIMRIARGLEAAIPHLEWLILSNNKLANIADLEPLASFPRLKYLSLLDNPVTAQPGYRLFVINRCKRLKVLDFRKVKEAEREEAEKVYGGKSAPAATAKTFEPEEELAKAAGKEVEAEPTTRKGPTPEQVTAIKAAIAAASTLEEVRRLEQALTSGQMPSELAAADGGQDAMEEG